MVQKGGLPTREPPINFGNQRGKGIEVELHIRQRQAQVNLGELCWLALQNFQEATEFCVGDVQRDSNAFVVVDPEPGSFGEGVQDVPEIDHIFSFSPHQDERVIRILEHGTWGVDQGVSDRSTVFDQALQHVCNQQE